MRAKEEAYRILESALTIASNGVDEAEVCLGGGDLGVTRFADNQIYPSMEQSREILSVRVTSGSRMCRVETTDLSTAGIKEAAQQARARADHMPESLKCPALPTPQNYQHVDAYDPETEALKGVDRTAMAARAVLAGHKGKLTASGLVMIRRGALGLDNVPSIFAVANTRGLLAYHPETRIRYEVSMKGDDGRNGWALDESFSSVALDIDELVASAVDKATRPGAVRTLKPGNYAAVLEPAAMGALLRYIGLTCGAERMASGSSFLSGHLGEKLVGESITIHDDHAHALHRGPPFDIEGVGRQKVTIIDKGVASSPVYCWASAERLEADATGHRVHDPFFGETEMAKHLVLEGGDATLSDLVGDTKSGVLISRLSSIQMLDPRTIQLTGVTRDGLFAIEDGEVTSPLTNMRFTLNLLELLSSVEAMSASTWTEGAVAPAAKVEGFNLHAAV